MFAWISVHVIPSLFFNDFVCDFSILLKASYNIIVCVSNHTHFRYFQSKILINQYNWRLPYSEKLSRKGEIEDFVDPWLMNEARAHAYILE